MTTEAQDVKNLIKWFRAEYPKYNKRTRLSLNGINLGFGAKASRLMNSFKSQGLVVGESDLVFLIPKHGFHGLVIKMKRLEGSYGATEDQLEYLEDLTKDNYFCCVCKGIEAAKETIKSYIDGG